MATPQEISNWTQYYLQRYKKDGITEEEAKYLAELRLGLHQGEARRFSDSALAKIFTRPQAPLRQNFSTTEEYQSALEEWKDKYSVFSATKETTAEPTTTTKEGTAAFDLGLAQYTPSSGEGVAYELMGSDYQKFNAFLKSHPLASSLRMETVFMLMNMPKDSSGYYIDFGSGKGYNIDQFILWARSDDGQQWQNALASDPTLAYMSAGYQAVDENGMVVSDPFSYPSSVAKWVKVPQGLKVQVGLDGQIITDATGNPKYSPMSASELESFKGYQMEAFLGAVGQSDLEPADMPGMDISGLNMWSEENRRRLQTYVNSGLVSAETAFGPGSEFEKWAIETGNASVEERARQEAQQGLSYANDPLMQQLIDRVTNLKAAGVDTSGFEQHIYNLMHSNTLSYYTSRATPYNENSINPDGTTTAANSTLNAPVDRNIAYIQQGLNNETYMALMEQMSKAEALRTRSMAQQMAAVYGDAWLAYQGTFTDADYQPQIDDPGTSIKTVDQFGNVVDTPSPYTAANLTGPDEFRDPYFEYFDPPDQTSGFIEFINKNPQYKKALAARDQENFKKYGELYQSYVDQRFNPGGAATWAGWLENNPLLKARVSEYDKEEADYQSQQRRYASATKTPRTRWLNY